MAPPELDAQIGVIRSSKADPQTLAAEFGVSASAIYDIQGYRSYSESATKVRERSESVFTYAKRRRQNGT